MSKMVKIVVDGLELEAEEKTPLLPVLLDAGFDIPTLCHHEAVSPYGACRLCLVEINRKGWKPEWRKLTTSCNFPVLEGLTVYTHSEKVLRQRRLVIELILARVPGSARVRDMAEAMGVTGTRFREQDEDCILCGLCSRVCDEVVGVHALTFLGRGGVKGMSTPYMEASDECIACGACAYVCPVDCIRLIQTPTHREIDRWGVVREMAVSEESGLPFAPRGQLEHFRRRANLPADFYAAAPGEKPR